MPQKTKEKRDSYHHGDLRAALLRAGEKVLSETGVEGFSLRRVAREVGVSHSAPAHHFGDTGGLLDALATDGFTRFRLSMEAEQARAGDDPKARLLASGRGYLRFAETSPALLTLMFGTRRSETPSAALEAAANAAFSHLVDSRNAARGTSEAEEMSDLADIIAIWSLVHGLASLTISGRLKRFEAMTEADRERFIAAVLQNLL